MYIYRGTTAATKPFISHSSLKTMAGSRAMTGRTSQRMDLGPRTQRRFGGPPLSSSLPPSSRDKGQFGALPPSLPPTPPRPPLTLSSSAGWYSATLRVLLARHALLHQHGMEPSGAWCFLAPLFFYAGGGAIWYQLLLARRKEGRERHGQNLIGRKEEEGRYLTC